MCGRYALAIDNLEFTDFFGLPLPQEWLPHWNITPGRQIPIIRLDAEGVRECVPLKWGLVPRWADDAKMGNRLANARGETVAQKPSFRQAFKARRCLIPASGFYEWDPGVKPKQPYYISGRADAPLAMAGLWERWQNRETEETLETCCIITTAPNELLLETVHHDRMPTLLHARDWDTWLDSENQVLAKVQKLIKPYPAKEMRAWPVSTRVNRPGDNEAGLIEPLSL